MEELISFMPNLKRYALSLTGNRDDALDLVQDTCLKAIKYKEKFDGVNYKAWILTICKNSFINDYRREKKANEIVDVTPDLYYINQSQEKLETEYNAKELQQFINQLQPSYRIPFQMYLDGYQYDEIAEILGLKMGTVKSRMFFARQQLMEDIKNDNLKPTNIDMEKEKLITKFREIYHRILKDGTLKNKSAIVKETGLFWTTITPILTEADMAKLVLKTQKGTFEKMKAFCDKYDSNKSATEGKKESVLEKKEPTNKCPHGHIFGKDMEKHHECDTCSKWADCFLLHKGNQEPRPPATQEEVFWNAIGTAQRNCPSNVTLTIVINK